MGLASSTCIAHDVRLEFLSLSRGDPRSLRWIGGDDSDSFLTIQHRDEAEVSGLGFRV